nr:hypothetical protein [Tanacetum cinerariifolium]
VEQAYGVVVMMVEKVELGVVKGHVLVEVMVV